MEDLPVSPAICPTCYDVAALFFGDHMMADVLRAPPDSSRWRGIWIWDVAIDDWREGYFDEKDKRSFLCHEGHIWPAPLWCIWWHQGKKSIPPDLDLMPADIARPRYVL